MPYHMWRHISLRYFFIRHQYIVKKVFNFGWKTAMFKTLRHSITTWGLALTDNATRHATERMIDISSYTHTHTHIRKEPNATAWRLTRESAKSHQIGREGSKEEANVPVHEGRIQQAIKHGVKASTHIHTHQHKRAIPIAVCLPYRVHNETYTSVDGYVRGQKIDHKTNPLGMKRTLKNNNNNNNNNNTHTHKYCQLQRWRWIEIWTCHTNNRAIRWTGADGDGVDAPSVDAL